MRLFHCTPSAPAILRDGFRDADAAFMTTRLDGGVWLSSVVPHKSEGARGEHVLEVHLPHQLAAQFERVAAGATCREFLIPAAIVNRYGPPHLMSEREIAAVEDPRVLPLPRLRQHPARKP